MGIRVKSSHVKVSRTELQGRDDELRDLLPGARVSLIDGQRKYVFGPDGLHERDGLTAAILRDFEKARDEAILKDVD